ncbi:MAG: demethoxyubiquinone hydroxylase family protein [Sphingomonas bacterium]|uniref:demethoxyubiquinone hydroxylase family protein n=1 Tax=Sphingomonas bacterium TaxID=1895847 RepID=UPI00261EED26|nr:demethoxyubiquinone hydroxylase family protein [Sphingomonas bacterium]MDB5706828.1 demethoxyubiquinone hydroxylase family protein [Sphingomonas bacterium]
MTLAARLAYGETLGDRVMKVDHAGEHGAICIYRAQRWMARWTAPDLVAEIDGFLLHERRHRMIFGAELARRGRSRCRSFLACGLGGFVLGAVTGLLGRQAIAATTLAIEAVVLRHMHAQIAALDGIDPQAVAALRDVIAEEQAHHDASELRLGHATIWSAIIDPIVGISTESVIWLGMRL